MKTYYAVIQFEFTATSPEDAARQMFDCVDDLEFNPTVDIQDKSGNSVGLFDREDVETD